MKVPGHDPGRVPVDQHSLFFGTAIASSLHAHTHHSPHSLQAKNEQLSIVHSYLKRRSSEQSEQAPVWSGANKLLSDQSRQIIHRMR